MTVLRTGSDGPRSGAARPATHLALLSDLDGVLVDSSASVERAWRRWAAEQQLPFDTIESCLHGIPSRQTIARFAPHLDVASEARRLDLVQAEDTGGVAALPGASVLLSGGYALRFAIVTSCVDLLAHARLNAAGLPVPPVTITSDMVERGKPDPEAYLLGAERLGVPPADCVVLEDAPAGVAAGRAAGMRVVALTTTHAPGELREADVVIADLRELPSVLGTD
jgi:mannitol-1-/sugar-/sorbitol-6-phosphatase